MTVVYDYRAITAYYDHEEYRWNGLTDLGTPVIVTYHFLEDSELPLTGDVDVPENGAISGVASFNAQQRAQFEKAAEMYSQAAGIVFVEVDSTMDAMIDVYGVLGTEWGGWAHYAYSSDSSTGQGDFQIDLTDDPTLSTTSWFRVVLHELGHAVGLSHTFEGTYTLAPAIDNANYTVMTYNWNIIGNGELASLDLEALQFLYGDPVDTTGWTFVQSGATMEIGGSNRAETILGVGAENSIDGKGGDDLLIGRDYYDTIKGGAGNDTIFGFAGSDKLYGGNGADTLYANSETDIASDYDWDISAWAVNILKGEGGNDTLFGGNGKDRLFGDVGQDSLVGGEHNDTLFGGAGKDRLSGGENNDILNGGGLRDWLDGDAGFDTLNGNAGSDILDGGADSDTLNGGAGNDRLTGGAGYDSFVFEQDSLGGVDTITDFGVGIDWLDLSALGWSVYDARTVEISNGLRLNWGDAETGKLSVKLLGVTLEAFDSYY